MRLLLFRFPLSALSGNEEPRRSGVLFEGLLLAVRFLEVLRERVVAEVFL